LSNAPLVSGVFDVPSFDRKALIKALRIDQAGESTFPEFLAASWRARLGQRRQGLALGNGFDVLAGGLRST
jgi:hypothetical protein